VTRFSDPFTIAQGLAVQTAHLAQWRRVLRPETYSALSKHVQERNARLDLKHDSGYDVYRGTDLTEFVQNYAARLPDISTP